MLKISVGAVFVASVALAGCVSETLPDQSLDLSSETSSALNPAEANAARLIWDEYGVGHVFSASDEAGFYAFGWAQMEARSDLILELYTRSRGHASKYFGSDLLETDVLTHSFGIPEKASIWFNKLDPEEQLLLNAFVKGMNDWAVAHPDKVPDYLQDVLPITADDPLAHLYQIVHIAFISYGTLEGATASIQGSPGSNGYAIAPARSASENAMLVINPHLYWSDLFTWFETRMSIPRFDIYGVALVGTPFLGIGFNENGGWTHTVNQYDGIDLYGLALNEDGYVLDGETLQFDQRQVEIEVLQEDGSMVPIDYPIKESVHGPVLFEEEGFAVAARVAAWDSYGMLDQYFDMAAATTLEEFEAAQSRLQMPFFNTLYANADGDISYLYGGRVPDRGEGSWWDWWDGILPGDDSSKIWTEYLSYEDMPKYKNPQSGFIQNANDAPWLSTVPKAISPSGYKDWVAPDYELDFRAQRSLSQVLADDSITFDELVEMKQSNRFEMADRFVDPLLSAIEEYGDDDAKLGARVLANWDRTTDSDSKGAILFLDWADRMLWPETEEPSFVTNASKSAPYLNATEFASPESAARVFGGAVRNVKARYGDIAIAHGEVVRLRLGDLDYPASGTSERFGAFRTSEAEEDESGEQIVTSGDSMVAVVEFGDRLRAVGNLSYGNFGDPGSPFFGKGLELYSQSKLRPIRYYPEDLLASAVSDTVISSEKN